MILAWHFLPTDHRLRYGDGRLVKAGGTLRVKGPPKLCSHGLHASFRPLDALVYAGGPIACYVGIGGEIDSSNGRLCGTERTVLWMVDATNTVHEFACWCAEHGLLYIRKTGHEPHEKSWAAIEAKRRWLRREITDEQLAEACLSALAVARKVEGLERSVAEKAALAARASACASIRGAGADWNVYPGLWARQNYELEKRLWERYISCSK